MSDDIGLSDDEFEAMYQQRTGRDYQAEMKERAYQAELERRGLGQSNPQDDRDAVRRAYGGPGVGAGQPPLPPGPDARMQELFRKMVGPTDEGGGRRRNITADEAAEYLHTRSQQVFQTAKAMGWSMAGSKRGEHHDQRR